MAAGQALKRSREKSGYLENSSLEFNLGKARGSSGCR
jgi:hypothetical protein